MRIAVLGTGLIGGSVALAARERLRASVTGWDPSDAALGEAVRRGALDSAGATVAEAVSGAEAVFCAAPVAALPDLVTQALAAAGPDCVVTDVGSTKRAIVAAHSDQRFVGGHPLAGAETGGVAHARADLFEGATWYLTPSPQTDGILYEHLHGLLTGIGARPAAIDAETHDQVLAAVSHLPHVLANVLVDQAAATLAQAGERIPAAGPSFRDTTPVAGAPSAIWAHIYLANRDALIAQVDGVLERLTQARAALAAGDAQAITAWNDGAGENRHALLGAGLTGGPVHELRVSVPNRPGVIAELALALGRSGVNIVDMTLSPSADMRDGVVALGIAGEDAADRARDLIAGLGHPVQQL